MDAGSGPKDSRLSDSETEFPLADDSSRDNSDDEMTYVQDHPEQSENSEENEE